MSTSLKRAGLFEEVKDRLQESGTGLSGGQQQRLCIARAIAVNPEIILMDEPCSALDPIATAKIEELIDELRENYTIVIVTHSMQQAARVSQRAAFFHLGELVEEGPTRDDVHDAERQAHARLHHRPLRLSGQGQCTMADQHTAKAFDADLQDLARMVAEMGGLAEKQIADSVDALARRDTQARPARSSRSIRPIDALQREIEERGDPDHRAPPADGGRPARDRRRAARLERSRADRRSRQEHRQARHRARHRDLSDRR